MEIYILRFVAYFKVYIFLKNIYTHIHTYMTAQGSHLSFGGSTGLDHPNGSLTCLAVGTGYRQGNQLGLLIRIYTSEDFSCGPGFLKAW